MPERNREAKGKKRKSTEVKKMIYYNSMVRTIENWETENVFKR